MKTKRDILRSLRDEALRLGELFYEGGPCLKCSGTKRYASNTACVACTQEKNAECRARVVRYKENSRLGPPVYEKHYTLRLLKPWPHLQLAGENIIPPPSDSIPYHATYSNRLPWASSANDVAELG
jgi:hypothetical protein